MSPGRDALDERVLRRLLDRAAEGIEPVGAGELSRAAHAASAREDPEHLLQLAGRGAPARRSSRPARWAAALAATLVLALLGGIGLGRQLTPVAESVEAPVLPTLAPGFAPAGAWTVVDEGIDVPPGTRAVLAANVPLDGPGEQLELVPGRVLAELPEPGIVIAVVGRVATEEEQGEDAPLRLADGARDTLWAGPAGGERPLAEYALRGRHGGLELDVRVYFGTAEPAREELAVAQAQLDRLVVVAAASQVTIAARPASVRWGETIALSGAVAGGRAGERVTIEIRECGSDHWRAHGVTTTTSGGQWFSETTVPINAALRARTESAVSGGVGVVTSPSLTLFTNGRRPYASAGAAQSFWRREVVLQRYDAPRRRWVAVGRSRIHDSGGGGHFVWGQAYFSARLTPGSLYRAVMTDRQTGPCYLAGFSNMARP
jgi:hypothetical protein